MKTDIVISVIMRNSKCREIKLPEIVQLIRSTPWMCNEELVAVGRLRRKEGNKVGRIRNQV